jgi:hypothetical protein
MVEKLGEIDYRIIYASFLIIVVAAIAINLSYEKLQDILGVSVIVLVALGNIGYIYSKRRKPEKK